MMKKQLLLFILALIPLLASADPVEIDGIWYNLVSKIKEAEVTHAPDESIKYSGKIIIPENVTYNGETYKVTQIGEESFQACKGVHEIVIPATITKIGHGAFKGSGLSSILIPGSVQSIEATAFWGCNLTNIIFEEGLKSIGQEAFKFCSGLTTVIIPESVETIGIGVFSNCSNLSSVNIPHKVKRIEWYVFGSCEKLTTITIPDEVTFISRWAFNHSGLTSIIIPNNVSEIELEAFNGCNSLKTVTIGSGIKKLGSKVFSKCPELTDVYCYAKNVPETYANAFEDSYPEYATLHVPKASIGAYKDATPWKNFKNVVKIGKPEHTLTYVVDGETYKTYEVEEGESITPEPDPIKEGYTFSGWSEIPATMPDHDVTVTGSFTINKYTLTYMVDGEVYKTFEVEYGESIMPEEEPTKEGYTFSGWSWIPSKMPAEDVTVTGSFTINKYKLTYMVDDEVYKFYELEFGEAITPEEEPTKEGYTFSGWSEIPTTMPDYDVTVIGSFTINKYTLAYMVDGEVYKTFEMEYGEAITPEDEPTKEGYTFSGWSWIPSKMPGEDVTVTGSFTVNSYKLTYMIDDKVYKEVTYEYGATITPEPQPEGDYQTFEWVNLPETMPAHDVMVYASYTTDIAKTLTSPQRNARFYSMDGKPQVTLQKGLNIVRMSDGTTKKVVVK